MVNRVLFTLALVLAGAPGAADHFCDDPPIHEQLTGVSLTVDASASQGQPTGFAWFITPPDQPTPLEPTSTETTHVFTPDSPGLWSVALVADYAHEAPLGGLWSSETCVTVRVASVVAAIGLDSIQVPTDEELHLDGFDSVWSAGVQPTVEWLIDGLALGACNGGPPPASPAELECTVPANWLDPGWHTAGLRLTDPASGDSSLATADFEVIEVIPLSVELSWSPVHPDPGEPVFFTATVPPTISEQDLILVEWDMGDGTGITYTSCPQPWASCLVWPHVGYTVDGWYDVSITVQTSDEIASDTEQIEVGDPVAPPTASFSVAPPSPSILEPAAFTFDGVCEGTCQFTWDFGDGGQSTEQQPVHSWVVPDLYVVELTVVNDGGSDTTTRTVQVSSCWQPAPPTQDGQCFGGPVWLTAPAGSAWLWSTGATSQTVALPFAGDFWVDIDDGTGCWGYDPFVVVLNNCGDPGGDANLDAVVDAADLAAMIPELTDGDGDAVSGTGGGDLTAPGGDVTRDDYLTKTDHLTVLLRLFE